jgi:two-component system nitrate/nitrite response regulator NarL
VGPFTIFVCEAQPIALAGLQTVFTGSQDIQLIGKANGFTEALPAIAAQSPDLVLLGQSSPPKPVLPQISEVIAASPSSRVVLWVVDLHEHEVFRALQLGARGILRKIQDPEVLLGCLRAVANGSIWIEDSLATRQEVSSRRDPILRITPREREIIEQICRGLKNREIASALSITPGTVKVHLMHIFEKTGTKDRFQLALQGRRLLGLDEIQVQEHLVAKHG